MTEAAPPRSIGVVVVTFNSETVLAGLLDSLDAAMGGCEWQLVVVDNDSADGSTALVRSRFPEATVIELGANLGYAAAINRGLDALPADCDLLALNPDVVLDEGLASKLAARLRTSESIGIVAPRLEDPGAPGVPSPTLRREPTIRRALAETFIGAWRAGMRGWGEAVCDPAAYEAPTAADWVSGAALMISRECLDACGPWDESFFLYSEDTEYALRARDHGFLACLEPGARATHAGGDSRSDPRLWKRLVLNKVALYHRRHGRALAVGFWLASCVRELRLGLTGNRPSWAALRGLVVGSKQGWTEP